jgi:hypothetical protein
MDFRLTPAQEALASVARRFATEQLPDLARCRESDGQVVLRGTKRWRMRDTRQFTDGGDLPLVRRGALGAGSAVAGLR